MPASGSIPPSWSPWDAIAACPWNAFDGIAWRAHWQRYPAHSWEGSHLSSGRYNRGPLEFPGERTWAVLYLALAPEICWAEITRHGPVQPLHNQFLLSTLQVHLSKVVDCRDPARLGIDVQHLLRDQTIDGTAYHVPQELALAALEQGADGILAPSATLLGDSLIVLPDNVDAPTTQIAVLESRPMHPYNPGLPTE